MKKITSNERILGKKTVSNIIFIVIILIAYAYLYIIHDSIEEKEAQNHGYNTENSAIDSSADNKKIEIDIPLEGS